MGKETKSRTEKESFIEERIFSLGDHYKTTISDGGKKATGRGRTSAEAEKTAKDKLDRKK